MMERRRPLHALSRKMLEDLEWSDGPSYICLYLSKRKAKRVHY